MISYKYRKPVCVSVEHVCAVQAWSVKNQNHKRLELIEFHQNSIGFSDGIPFTSLFKAKCFPNVCRWLMGLRTCYPTEGTSALEKTAEGWRSLSDSPPFSFESGSENQERLFWCSSEGNHKILMGDVLTLDLAERNVCRHRKRESRLAGPLGSSEFGTIPSYSSLPVAFIHTCLHPT